MERLQAYLATEGQALTEDHIFRDDGYSGSSLNRPGLDQLRDRIKRACFERVLITSPDRLARRFVHQMLLMEEFEREGCEVQFLDRPMSQDPHDQLLLQIRGAVAEYERVLIAERMRRGRQLRLRSGTLLPWTTPPLRVSIRARLSAGSGRSSSRTDRGSVGTGTFRSLPGAAGQPARFGEISAGVRCIIAARQSTLERSVIARDSDQSGLYGQAVYRSSPFSTAS